MSIEYNVTSGDEYHEVKIKKCHEIESVVGRILGPPKCPLIARIYAYVKLHGKGELHLQME